MKDSLEIDLKPRRDEAHQHDLPILSGRALAELLQLPFDGGRADMGMDEVLAGGVSPRACARAGLGLGALDLARDSSPPR